MTIGLRICIVFSMVFGCYLNGMYNKENKTDAFLGSMCVAALHTRFVRIIQQDGTRCHTHTYCSIAKQTKWKRNWERILWHWYLWIERVTHVLSVSHIVFIPFGFAAPNFLFYHFHGFSTLLQYPNLPRLFGFMTKFLYRFQN